jgi:hypothetical protein
VTQLSSKLAGPIYMGDIKHPTIILEAVIFHDRWIWHACIILHNMIIDDERDSGYDKNYHTVTSVVAPPPASLPTILQRKAHLTSGLMFLNFQSDLIEHVWNMFH